MGLLRCPSDTKYEVTFYCPPSSRNVTSAPAGDEAASSPSSPAPSSPPPPASTSGGGAHGLEGSDTRSVTPAKKQATRLRITNGCEEEPIWVAHEAGAGVGPDPQNVRLKPLESFDS